jgi:sulfur relay (sulfurtransferase) DsrF/TusC family protein
MKTLNIVETAYRATLEEQDDTILWLSRSLQAAGAKVDVLLKGAAVSYALAAQDASGLALGTESQTQPPRLADDIAKLLAGGAAVYIVEDDLAERGIVGEEIVEGVERIRGTALAPLIAGYDRIWHW